jgi:cell division transport system ATP-binding protein
MQPSRPREIQPDGSENPVIRVFHATKRYAGKQALVDVTFDIAEKDFLFITGPSGAGKTTLLRLMYLGETVSEGQILVDGVNLSRVSRKGVAALRRKFGIVFQDFKLIPSRTVYENVALVVEALGTKRRLIRKKVDSVLRIVGMENRRASYPKSLSGGEQQRVAVARAIVGNPKILLADEPTGSLDAKAARHIFSLLQRFHELGATVLIATHDKGLIRRTGGKVAVLNQGRLEAITKIPKLE